MVATAGIIDDVSKTRIAGLERFYGVDDPRTLQFFEVHIEADEIHSQAGAAMVRRHVTDDASRAAVLATARECAGALRGFLDGCCREYVAA